MEGGITVKIKTFCTEFLNHVLSFNNHAFLDENSIFSISNNSKTINFAENV